MYYHATAGVADEIFLTFFKLYIFKNHSLFFTFSVYRHFFKKVFFPSDSPMKKRVSLIGDTAS
jgi:hypothetical protein